MAQTDTKPTTDDRPRQWHVRPLEDEADAYFVSRWWHHYFGSVHDYWEPRIPTPLAQCLGWVDENVASEAFVASHKALRVGGAAVCLYDAESTIHELPDGNFDRSALVGDRNGWMLMGAVDPAWRGRGIGRELFRRRLTWLDDRKADMVFAFGWERDAASSRPLFETYEFVPIQRFTYEVAGNRDACPDCGTWPSDDGNCMCEYTLWALDGNDIDVR